MTRFRTWSTHELPQFLAARQHTPFTYGTNDCSMFAADAILAMTGTDIADDFRGKYSDERTAFTLIRAVTGGSTVADAAAHCAQKHGLVEYTHPLLAKRGDLVVIEDAGNQLIAGVVGLDGRYALSVGDGGIKYLPISRVKKGWKV